MGLVPNDYIITRKRKKYRFALFHNNPLCFEADQWDRRPIDVLEIGAGTGLFSVALAEAMPTQSIVAIDVKADRLQKGAGLAQEKGLANVTFLRTRADLLLGSIRPNSLKALWVTFPDPFPKERAAKHRLTHPRFLNVYRQLLRPQEALYFKTDAKALFEWSLEQLVQEGWQIQEVSFDLHNSDLSNDYKMETTYECRFKAEGKPIGFVKALPPLL